MDLDFLRSVNIFSDLSENELTNIKDVCTTRNYPKNSMIILEEEMGDVVFIVMTGTVKITRVNDEGKEVILAMLGSGEVFGELMLWDVVDNQLIHRWVAHQSEISTVRFSPDGTRILSRSITELNPENPKRPNQVLRMWSTDSFEQIGADLIANREQVNTSQLKDPKIIAPFDFNVEVEMLTDAYESG